MLTGIPEDPVADWLNKKALAVERLGPPLITPRNGVRWREAAHLKPARGLGSAVSSPSGVCSRQRLLRILNRNLAFIEVTF